MIDASPPAAGKPMLHRRKLKALGIGLWLLLIGAYLAYLWVNQLSAAQALDQIVTLLETPWGPILYILIYTFSPLIFFSAAALAVTGGCIFGAGSLTNLALAMLYTTIGSLGAAQVAYWMGCYFGADLLPAHENMATRYAERMRRHSFMTVLIMHLLFLPYELVNYLAGIVRVNRLSFLVATFLGSLPGLFTFIPFGASLDMKKMMAGEGPEVSWRLLLLSLGVLVVSLVTARTLRKREATLHNL
ncbi:MAG: TVP38/TMEM64 family protein [Caldilineaceae bacterium]|nr:TVP38/TMEM64 family protein [Caldilineaceae bacterium]